MSQENVEIVRRAFAEFERGNSAVWTLRDGKVISLISYNEPAEALEAVGLSEQDAHADS